MSSKEKCSDEMMTNPRKADEQCEKISERKCQRMEEMKKKEEENEQFQKEIDEKWNKIYIENGNNFTPQQLTQYNSEVADVIMKYEGEEFKYFNTGKVSNISESIKMIEEEEDEEEDFDNENIGKQSEKELKNKTLLLRSCGENENQVNVKKEQRVEAKKIKNERYVVPSGNGIASESVRKADSFLREFDQEQYNKISKWFHAYMKNRDLDIEEGKYENCLEMLWELFIENKGLDKSDFTVRNMIKKNINFSRRTVNYFLEDQEENKVKRFLQALKNVGLLKKFP